MYWIELIILIYSTSENTPITIYRFLRLNPISVKLFFFIRFWEIIQLVLSLYADRYQVRSYYCVVCILYYWLFIWVKWNNIKNTSSTIQKSLLLYIMLLFNYYFREFLHEKPIFPKLIFEFHCNLKMNSCNKYLNL